VVEERRGMRIKLFDIEELNKPETTLIVMFFFFFGVMKRVGDRRGEGSEWKEFEMTVREIVIRFRVVGFRDSGCFRNEDQGRGIQQNNVVKSHV
jgi:hypothetical protein